ncbi:MAG: hypothetical protein LBV55_02900 [Acholeplasmatales bacterium]|jgi:hypothetical protein|nr:hypothetical protein [Acholeplasmatales bacterium]
MKKYNKEEILNNYSAKAESLRTRLLLKEDVSYNHLQAKLSAQLKILNELATKTSKNVAKINKLRTNIYISEQQHLVNLEAINLNINNKIQAKSLSFDKELQIDKVRYQKNNFPNFLILVGLVLSIIAMFMSINHVLFTEINSKSTKDFVLFILVAVEIVIGIVSMLVTFLCSEKVKLFIPIWCRLVTFILAAVNILRIFILPFYYIVNHNGLNFYLAPIILWIVGAVFYVIAGIYSTNKVNKLLNHMKKIKREAKNV